MADVRTIDGKVHRDTSPDASERTARALLRAHEAIARVAAIHRSTYDVNGEPNDHLVPVYVDVDEPSEADKAFLASHECRRFGWEHERCDPNEGEHYHLACVVCGGVMPDGDMGFELWPCDTARAIAETAAALAPESGGSR